MSSTNDSIQGTRTIAQIALTIPVGSIVTVTIPDHQISFVVHDVLVNPDTRKTRIQPRCRLQIWWIEIGFEGVNGDMTLKDITVSFGKSGTRTCTPEDVSINDGKDKPLVTLSDFLEKGMKEAAAN